ncbi:MAG: hypothetical protein R2795_04160 [Saprospiraceae bacterium]
MQDSFLLQAFVSPPNGHYLFQWTGPGILRDADSLTCVINSLGTYTFEVLDMANGCVSAATIVVQAPLHPLPYLISYRYP